MSKAKAKVDRDLKSLKITGNTHTKLKVFIARRKVSIIDFADQAVLEKMKRESK